MPHRVCPECGFYNGKLIVPKKVKKSKVQQQPEAENQEEQK
jgi:large subunit ribosomal protein L32